MSAERRLFFDTSQLSRSTEDKVNKFRSEVGVGILKIRSRRGHFYKDRVNTGPHGPTVRSQRKYYPP